MVIYRNRIDQIMVIYRNIQAQIEKLFGKGKAIALYGPRRIGKTTLVKKIEENFKGKSTYLNCDERDVRHALTDKTSTELIDYIGNSDLVIIDEAQRVPNIGLTLKLLVDNFPEVQILATGSSSFDLSNKIKEPLTGRVLEFYLYPLSLNEISKNKTETDRLLATRLIYGTYPEIVTNTDGRIEILKGIYNKYLYKDALEFQGLKNPEALEKLISALALQIGQQVSYTELANLVGLDQKTITSYIRILELSFVIFKLPPLSRNLRTEISKSRKIYFWDLGIRNAAISNFNSLNLRSDAGMLWENFLLIERQKRNEILRFFPNKYFWRTWKQQEIDYIEEDGGILNAYEFKMNKNVKRAPKTWTDNYPNSRWLGVNKENYLDFIRI